MRILTDEDAYTIRRFYQNGTKMPVLRDLYGVGKTTIKNIIHGDTYVSAGGPISPPRKIKPALHGSTTRYSQGCRCPLCSEANRIRCIEWRDRRRALGLPPK